MLRLRQLLLGVQVGEARAVALVEQLLAQAHLLVQERHRRVQLGDLGADLGGFGLLLIDLLIQAGEPGALLGGLGARSRVGLLHFGRRRPGRSLKPDHGAACRRPVRQRRQPGDIELGLSEIVCQPVAIGSGVGGVELDQHIVGLHMVAILNPDRPDHARIQRLHHLELAHRRELTGRGGDDVDLADEGPGEGQHQEQHDGDRHRPSGGRRRGLQHLKRGGQEFALVPALEPLDHAPEGAGNDPADLGECHVRAPEVAAGSKDCKAHSWA